MLIFGHILWRMDPLKEHMAATTDKKGKKRSQSWIFIKEEEEDIGDRSGPEGCGP